MIRVFLWLLFYILTVYPVEATSLKYDGDWTLTVYSYCQNAPPPTNFMITIRNAQLASDKKGLDIEGKISDNGIVIVRVSSNNDTLYSSGHLTQYTGSGKWKSNNCLGKWRAVKNNQRAIYATNTPKHIISKPSKPLPPKLVKHRVVVPQIFKPKVVKHYVPVAKNPPLPKAVNRPIVVPEIPN